MYIGAAVTTGSALACCQAHMIHDADLTPFYRDGELPPRTYFVAGEETNGCVPFFRAVSPQAIRAAFPRWNLGTIYAVSADGKTLSLA
jgi:hypothetical protein